MKIPCEIDKINTIKNGMKIILAIDNDNVEKVMKDIHKYINRSLMLNIEIDKLEEKKKAEMISPLQRKKIYALFNDIANHTGNGEDYVKEIMKKSFYEYTGYPQFSLASCEKEVASDFIEFILNVTFKQGIPINDKPSEIMDDIEKAMLMCIKYKKCSICGKEGEIHHIDTIGMGNNRKKTDDSNYRKICLCRIHHTEAHQKGWTDFSKKYHVKGVIVNV